MVTSTQHDVLHTSVYRPLRYVAFIAFVIWNSLRQSFVSFRVGPFAEPADHFNDINVASCNTVSKDKGGFIYRLTCVHVM